MGFQKVSPKYSIYFVNLQAIAEYDATMIEIGLTPEYSEENKSLKDETVSDSDSEPNSSTKRSRTTSSNNQENSSKNTLTFRAWQQVSQFILPTRFHDRIL